MHIVGFYVKKEYRGLGVGNRLLETMLNRIREYEGVLKVSLAVNSNQQAAYTLYEKFGFGKVGELQKELKVGEDYFDQVLMDLFL